MRLVKVGATALNQTPLDWRGNLRNITTAIDVATADDVSILCLPELCITGHGCEDAFQSPDLQRYALDMLFEIRSMSAEMVITVGLPVLYRKALFDAVAVLANGHLRGFVCKKYLAGDGLYYEPRWFTPWPSDAIGEIVIEGERYPIGDLVFDCDGVGIGFEICEEAWVAQRPGRGLAARGADILLNPSASHFAFGKHEIRRRFVQEGSRAFGVAYVYSNLLGNESGRMVFDGGAMIAAGGELVAEGPRFSYQDVELTTAVVDIDDLRMRQARIGSFRPEFGDSEEVVECGPLVTRGAGQVDSTVQPVQRSSLPISPADLRDHSKEEEFTEAVCLALFDYLRKSRSRGFVVSASGGADSSATSVLVATMVRFALRRLGEVAFRDKLEYLDLDSRAGEAAVTRQLLTCVYQATRNSGTATRRAAAAVSEEIGAEFLVLDVDSIVEDYVELIEHGIGRELSWNSDDISLQNIQARARGPSVWLLANLKGALLLATSNRSEAAVGYATMDGDTCGGLSPIAGIDKAFLRQWLHWMETIGPEEVGPFSSLRHVNALQPTAELRPREADQTDESDLMPYEILDAIERAAIRDKKAPLAVLRTLQVDFAEIPESQLVGWIERFFRLWCRNQWKRERYAPSFHVDDENLDPKSWCRFPILSGGFELELEELRNGGRGD